MLPRHHGWAPRARLGAHGQREDDRLPRAHPGPPAEARQGLRESPGGGPLPGAGQAPSTSLDQETLFFGNRSRVASRQTLDEFTKLTQGRKWSGRLLDRMAGDKAGSTWDLLAISINNILYFL